MEDLLMQLKKEMMSTHNRKLSQPLEGKNSFNWHQELYLVLKSLG